MQPRRGFVPVLPMALTLGNLACGFVAMAKTVDALNLSAHADPFDPAFASTIATACWFVLAAMVFDALDGTVARLTGQASPFGAQLDSLSDIVTFGAAPALIAKIAYEHAVVAQGLPSFPRIVTALCSLYLIGAALRLARYTVGATGHEDDGDPAPEVFVGLPSPAAAAAIVTTCLFAFEGRLDVRFLPEPASRAVALFAVHSLPYMACVLGALMFSRVPYVHLAKRYFAHRLRFETFVIIVFLAWALIFLHGWLLCLLSLAYVVGGLALGLRARLTGRSPADALPSPHSADEGEQDR